MVLAGRPNVGAFSGVSEARWEALIDIDGRPMVIYVVEALRAATRVDRVAVVGPPEPLRAVLPGEVVLVENGESLSENLRRGFAALVPGNGGNPVLVAGCDVPLITGPIVDAFLSACEQVPASLHYPVVERSVCEARFPGMRRTYATLTDGTFTGGNIFLVAPALVPVLLELLDRFYAARKSPWRLAWLLGPGILAKFVCKRASIRDIETLFLRLTGHVGRAVVVQYPEVGVDVDKPEDLKLVRRLLAKG